jgi:hypothetical protein
MNNVFFVHGTGVRDAGYYETMSLIAKGLKPHLPNLKLSGVSWGTLTGVDVSEAEIESVLPLAGTQAVGAPSPQEVTAEFWSSLMDDPLFELRLLTARTSPGTATIQVGVPTTAPPKPMAVRLQALTQPRNWPSKDGSLEPPAGGVSLEGLQKAADWLASDPNASAVLNQAEQTVGTTDDPELVQPTARAVVAYTLVRERGELGRGPDALFVATLRDSLIQQVEKALSGGVQGGVFDWATGLAIKFAEAKATAFGKSRRAGLMGNMTPGIGDILLWQRRGGEKISKALLQGIQDAGDNVIVVGHSLGGIMLVDLLSAALPPTNVKKLVTVGSQAPFFLLSDALEFLRRPGANAKPFTPWLNIFDRNDFLSFCAKRVFPSAQGIEDFEAISGVSFPDSHGAYWRSDAVYKKIAEFCQKP